mmetsp:Transcript_20854/g.23235  ORF Transcript_20854/g.23235 Transcript_20854/m.23235 type:complete len:96 (-) Transcript_20854:574-861(-)
MFIYSSNAMDDYSVATEIAFIENDRKEPIFARVDLAISGQRTIKMDPYSVIIFVDGVVKYDSAFLNQRTKSFRRVKLLNYRLFFWIGKPLLNQER